LVKGNNLANADGKNDKSDPYVKIKFNGQKKLKEIVSKKIKNNLNP